MKNKIKYELTEEEKKEEYGILKRKQFFNDINKVFDFLADIKPFQDEDIQYKIKYYRGLLIEYIDTFLYEQRQFYNHQSLKDIVDEIPFFS